MSYLRKNIAEMAGYVPGFQPPDEALPELPDGHLPGTLLP